MNHIMSQLNEREKRVIDTLLQEWSRNSAQKGPVSLSQCTLSAFSADGSNRKFFRLYLPDGASLVVIVPEKQAPADLKEAYAAWRIGNHLALCDVPVPALYGYDQSSGILLSEDLGSTLLHSVAQSIHSDDPVAKEHVRLLYQKAVECLVNMQLAGTKGFAGEWCWDTSVYSRELMLNRESGYFLKAFWQDYLGKRIPEGISNEFEMLANYVGSLSNEYFLFRDFQSRNIMVQNEKIRCIDYQGGRFGPLAYDLASLLIDPYVQLPKDLQAELYNHYLHVLSEKHYVADDFRKQYSALYLQRNLQILGAFSFLTIHRRKPFFKNFILPSLISMDEMLRQQDYFPFPVLRTMVEEGLEYVTADRQ